MPEPRYEPSAPDPEALAEALADAARRGASMEEIAALRDPEFRTPEEAVRALKAGNARFFGGETVQAGGGANERRAQIIGQTPFALVLGCSDSRVPIETVFDVGFGDLFVVRVAGNVPDASVLGSIEYGVRHLKCSAIVVLGHEGCGAVEAAFASPEDAAGEPEHVQRLVSAIRPAVEHMPHIRDKKARMREAVLHNVRLQTSRVRANPVVQEAEASGRVRVIGGFYEIGSGAVDFLLTEEELAV